ncbi:N-acetylglucosaminylphosphatidylinositol deacetylase [Ascoidea rubescens DSM 1968]|uniref:N-acetylglucosaminylphosphatidylinositol deacetylase n=1 Tax=Ascoidea rubescens DSM 1968 TaxID=1344418 RepID=A0A1D2VRK3_9ASCO|nr:N-acetylglucosaminyl phosphatidylinositol de-N-acetylase [Ascoidea rubescens DSM 1968]ODV64208.1 N-acetylglucosaminyl phosphatidylinositol de-N-acetylase [Ascoidea rubescens DSM 1968]
MVSLATFPKKLFKWFLAINLLWIFLSTTLPAIISSSNQPILKLTTNRRLDAAQLSINSIPSSLRNASIYLVIAHPDDEVMFFSPSIIELNKKIYNNTLNIICFSNGNNDGLGHIRSSEIVHSGVILGLDAVSIHVIQNEIDFKDSMSIIWDSQKISNQLNHLISNNKLHNKIVLLSFDQLGISNHPNHKSLYYGCLDFIKSFSKSYNHHQLVFYKLNSLNFFQKYSFTLLTNFHLLKNHLILLYSNNPSFDEKIVDISSNFPSVILSLAAMSFAHDSQMVWFRWGWLLFSRFLNYNQLIHVQF